MKKPKTDKDTCPHPPRRLYSWFARDDRYPKCEVLVVVCLDCHKTLTPKD